MDTPAPKISAPFGSINSCSHLPFSTPAIMDVGAVDNDTTMSTNANPDKPEEEEIDPIWLSSRTARQIYGLCQVEKVSIRYHHPTNAKEIAPLTVDGFFLWLILS